MEVPRHVAIIMDGNGRWAQARNRPRVYGHVRGSSRVKPIVKRAGELGIQALTLYAFSTENWSRPTSELEVLWKLMSKFLVREVEELHRNNVKMHFIGELDRIPKPVREIADQVVERLSKNTGLNLILGVSYGSRRELARATQLIADDCAKGKIRSADVDEEMLEKYLWTAPLMNLADVDLMIRTSGEKRISNFLCYQAAYAELFFSDVLWPDFTVEHFEKALQNYQLRDRRFGRVKDGKS